MMSYNKMTLILGTDSFAMKHIPKQIHNEKSSFQKYWIPYEMFAKI